MAELQRKKSIGSGNMSTPATTSSNASSSGYGYAPLYEALGLGSAPDAMASALLNSTSSGQTGANSYRSPTDTTGMTSEEIRAAAEAAATADPFSIGGINVGSQALGFGVSNLLSGAIGGIPGLLLGAVASRLARRAYEGEIRNQQTENFFNIIAQIDTSADLEGRAGSGRTEIDTTDPHNQWIADNVTITEEVSQSDSGDSSTSHNGDGTGQYGYNNPASSYASNRGNSSSSSSSNSWSSTGGYSSDGSTSNNGMSGGTGGAF